MGLVTPDRLIGRRITGFQYETDDDGFGRKIENLILELTDFDNSKSFIFVSSDEEFNDAGCLWLLEENERDSKLVVKTLPKKR